MKGWKFSRANERFINNKNKSNCYILIINFFFFDGVVLFYEQEFGSLKKVWGCHDNFRQWDNYK